MRRVTLIAVDRPALQFGDRWIAAHPILTIAAFLLASLLAMLLLGGSWPFVVFFGAVLGVLVVWNCRTRVRQN